jgi:hypothetical protein
MSEKLKIAICVSGQTRHFNEDPAYLDDFNKLLGLFDEYDYDLFGHTWADQEDPRPGVLKRFTEYRSDPQSIIWDAITPSPDTNNIHWTAFLTTRSEWMQKPEYIDIINNKSDINFIDFAKDQIYGQIGQVWSAHESFLLTKNHAGNKYDFVVKLRWDTMIRKHVLDHQGRVQSNTDDSINRFKEQLYNWSHCLNQWNFKTCDKYPSCLSLDNCVISERGNPYINDHLYVFKFNHFKNSILAHSPYDLFIRVLKEGSNNGGLGSAHSLWIKWILNSGFSVSPILPDIFTPNGPGENKPNKEWCN